MATGYTYPVADGSVTEFSEFAMQCARAFGALVSMRDSPMDAEIPDEIKPSTYAGEKAKEIAAKLAKLEKMSFPDAEKEAAKSYATQLKAHLEYRQQMHVENDRLDAMLKHVRDWTPPTADHREMKRFMIEQLSTSKHDLKWGAETPKEASPSEWLAGEIASARRDLAYYKKQAEEEQARAKERTEWVRQLRASLKPPRKAA